MKFNFRKIASVLASVVMIGSTIGIAAAANYPAPFIAGGVKDVALVYGSNAATSDLAAAVDVGGNLQYWLASQTATGSGSTTASTVSGGDYVKLEKSTDLFNLGNKMNDFFTSLDSDELSTVLADGVYSNDDNVDFDYDQKIVLGSLNLTHFQNSDFNDEKPVIGFDLADGTFILNYTLDFTPDSAEGGAAFVSLKTTNLAMLGRSYYIVDASGGANGVKLTLLDAANSATVTEGETSTVTVGDKSYEVSIDYIDTTDVILLVDGVKTNKLAAGDVFKVATDVYVAVKNNLYAAKESGISKAEISIGTGKIVLENGKEVEINTEKVSNIAKYNDDVLKAYITNSSTDIDKIVLEWTLGDDAWIAPGSDLVLPGFETIKLSMAGFTSPKAEVTKLMADQSDKAKIETYVEDGKISFNLLYANATGTGFAGIGKSATKRLATSEGLTIEFDMNADAYFVASWVSTDDAESYLLKVTDIDDSDPAKNTTTIESQASGSTKKLSLDIAETDTLGNIKFTLDAANEKTKNATITIAAASTGTASFDQIYTKEGLTMKLPVNIGNFTGVTKLDGRMNFTSVDGVPTTFVMNFTEETKDGVIGAGRAFTATWGFNVDEVEVDSVDNILDYETEDGSDNYIGYVVSDLATKTLYSTGGDQDTLDITYAGEESFADVYVSEAGAVISAIDNVVIDGSVVELGLPVIKDTEVSSESGKNLLVIGGSCVNQVAAKILAGSEAALCGAAFTESAGVGANQALIKVVKNPYLAADTTKIAMLVAGYEAADTTKALKYVTTEKPSTAEGTIKLATSSTVATVVTA